MIARIIEWCGKPQKPNDINSSSKRRGFEKRLAKILTYEQTEKIKKEIEVLRIKLFMEVNRIQKRNGK